jgi:TctA family transporter
MTRRGEAGRAMGIAIFDSTLNGVLYGVLAFLLLPTWCACLTVLITQHRKLRN